MLTNNNSKRITSLRLINFYSTENLIIILLYMYTIPANYSTYQILSYFGFVQCLLDQVSSSIATSFLSGLRSFRSFSRHRSIHYEIRCLYCICRPSICFALFQSFCRHVQMLVLQIPNSFRKSWSMRVEERFIILASVGHYYAAVSTGETVFAVFNHYYNGRIPMLRSVILYCNL